MTEDEEDGFEDDEEDEDLSGDDDERIVEFAQYEV